MKWKYKKKIISNEMNSTNDAISLEIICNKSMANSENNEKAMENMRRWLNSRRTLIYAIS